MAQGDVQLDTPIPSQEQNSSGKPRSDPNKIRVFISHSSADTNVATALYEELTDINRDRVECYLDTQTIASGKDWGKSLNEALASADWLVCIYYGRAKVSSAVSR